MDRLEGESSGAFYAFRAHTDVLHLSHFFFYVIKFIHEFPRPIRYGYSLLLLVVCLGHTFSPAVPTPLQTACL